MPEYGIGSFPERLMSASRGLANSPQDCSPRHCGAVALFDSSSPNPKRDPCVGTRHRGLFLERLMGVEPTSSAWKADVLAVVRQPRNNSTYYTHLRGCLSSPPGRVFLSLLPFCHFILHFAPLTILPQSTIINTESV